MKFPPSFIERLRSQSVMSEIIGRRMALKKHGREYQGLCPFHKEKSPSFTVNDAKGFFHCFGCGAHGDAIEFIKRHDRLSYPETLETLAREIGVPMPEFTPEESKKIEREKTLIDVLEASCQWFERQLQAASGAIAFDYIQARGLKPETIRNFRIGYAPEDKTALHQYLLTAGFNKALQQEAGLIIVTDNGSVYDRFRGRLVFPIRNASGKVVAFGGRLLGGQTVQKNLPKYLNSPETPLFKKGELLYNLDLAKRPARENNLVVVMEGYMDVVSSWQGGVNYAVATLGTATTAEHLKMLWQLAKEPVICLDGDAAGKRAMLRAAEIALPLLKPGYSLRFALLPSGEDPDSYIQKHGKVSFEKIVQNSQRLSQTLWDTLVPQYRLNLPEGRAALEDACKKLTDKITDPNVRSHYLDYFRKQLWTRTTTTTKGKTTTTIKAPLRSAIVEHMVVAHHSAALETLTQRLLKLLLKFPALLHKSQVEETLAHIEIRNHRLDALRNTLLLAHTHSNIDDRSAVVAYVQQQLPDGSMAPLIEGPLGIGKQGDMTLEDALHLWNETISAYEITHLQVELKQLEEHMGKTMDDAHLQRLVELQNAIRKANSRSFAPAESDIA
ncbi:MAG: DNA primase [Rickettsiales bacterium]|nr:DNA primase [Rickettsiales bacterium]